MSLSDFLFGSKEKKAKGPNWDDVRKAAWVGSNDVHTPYGNVTYAIDPKTDKTVQTTNYTPGQQALLTGSEGVSGSANALAQQLLAGMPQGAQSVSDSIYKQGASRLDPQFEQDLKLLQNRLYGQGIPENSDAWKDAIAQFTRGRTDAYQTLNNNAIMGRDQSLASQSNTVAQLSGVGRPIDLQPPPINAANMGGVGSPQQPASNARSGGIVSPLLQLGSTALGGWAYGGFQ